MNLEVYSGMTAIQALKEFFSVPERPVTNAELMELKKADSAGFTALAEEAKKALATAHAGS